MRYKVLIKILFLTIIDFLLIQIWILNMNIDPSAAMGIIILIPLVIILNLIIAGIFYFLKRKEISYLFLVNTIISSIILYILFSHNINNIIKVNQENYRRNQTEIIQN